MKKNILFVLAAAALIVLALAACAPAATPAPTATPTAAPTAASAAATLAPQKNVIPFKKGDKVWVEDNLANSIVLANDPSKILLPCAFRKGAPDSGVMIGAGHVVTDANQIPLTLTDCEVQLRR